MAALARLCWNGPLMCLIHVGKPREFNLLQNPRCSSLQLQRLYSDKCENHVIVMLRHGQSDWNQKNLFCGWYDSQLTEKGRKEACAAGKAIMDANLKFDMAYTSMLTRAQDTLQLVLKVIGQEDIPVYKSWRLNERHYGGLTGLNKADTAKRFGEEKVQIWRRSFDTPPPPMEKDHEYYECIAKDPRYRDEPKPSEFPKAESLKLTVERTLPYWNDVIVPQIRQGKRLIIAAHGNSLRGIVKHLQSISNKDIMKLNLPTGMPFVYKLDGVTMETVSPMKFLGDPEAVKKAMEAVAMEGKAK